MPPTEGLASEFHLTVGVLELRTPRVAENLSNNPFNKTENKAENVKNKI